MSHVANLTYLNEINTSGPWAQDEQVRTRLNRLGLASPSKVATSMSEHSQVGFEANTSEQSRGKQVRARPSRLGRADLSRVKMSRSEHVQARLSRDEESKSQHVQAGTR